MKILNALLFAVIVLLGYMLYSIIEAPIAFEKVKKHRVEVVKRKLIDIRNSQLAYKSVKRQFCNNFDSLISFIKNDSLMVISVIGNPDDTNQVVRRDTTLMAVKDSLFSKSFPVDSLQYEPFGGDETFEMDAGSLKMGGYVVQVFEAFVKYLTFLNDQDKEFVDHIEVMKVGSMTEASIAGNWE